MDHLQDMLVVPIINIEPYIANPSSPEAVEVIADICRACRTLGFFQVSGHGISSELQRAVFAASSTLFELPHGEKIKLLRDKKGGVMKGGYEMLGSQGSEEGKLPDLNESFYIAREACNTKEKPLQIASESPNNWPSSEVLREEDFKAPLTHYHEKMFELSLTLLEMLAAGLPYGPHIFDDFVSGDVIASLRLLRYPPQKADDGRQLGVGAHTDWGAITLLLQDETTGLQVFNEGSQIWLPIAPNRDAYVVNVGDMLWFWTKGVYKSGLHRVLNRSTRYRYSLPYFFDGNPSCVLEPLDGHPSGEVVTVMEHLTSRMTAAYARGGETDH